MSKKILFWIDVSLLQFGVAKMLQEKLDDEFYVIYDLNHHLKKSFKNQNIISFQNEWYYWDHVGYFLGRFLLLSLTSNLEIPFVSDRLVPDKSD